MDAATLLVVLMATLNPNPATFPPPPPQVAPSDAARVARHAKSEARERADRERRRWRAEQRRIAAARQAERERAAAEAARTSAPRSGGTSYTRGVECWRSLCARYFPGHVDEALYVIRGESGGDPRASNGTCRGLFQIHECHAATFARVTGRPYYDGVYDPDANAHFAAYLSRGGTNWSAWSVRP